MKQVFFVVFFALGLLLSIVDASSHTILSPLIQGYAQNIADTNTWGCSVDGVVLLTDAGYTPTVASTYISTVIEKNLTDTLMSIKSHGLVMGTPIIIPILWTSGATSITTNIQVDCEQPPVPVITTFSDKMYWIYSNGLINAYPMFVFKIDNFNKKPPPIAAKFPLLNQGADIRMLSNNIFFIHLVSVPELLSQTQIDVMISFDNFITSKTISIKSVINSNTVLNDYTYSGNIFPRNVNNVTNSRFCSVFNKFELKNGPIPFYSLLRVSDSGINQVVKVLGNDVDFTLFQAISPLQPYKSLIVFQPTTNLEFNQTVTFIEPPSATPTGSPALVSTPPTPYRSFHVQFSYTNNIYDIGAVIQIGSTFTLSFLQIYPYGYTSILSSNKYNKIFEFNLNPYFNGSLEYSPLVANPILGDGITPDKDAPIIQFISIEKITGNTPLYVLQAKITDATGFVSLSNFGDYTNLVLGSIKDGVYEFLYDPYLTPRVVEITDVAYNSKTVELFDFLNLQLLSLPKKTFNISTVTNVKFEFNDVNTTSSSVSNRLYIYTTDEDTSFYPFIVSQKNVFESEKNYGSYDTVNGCYSIPFTIKKNSITGVYDYYIYVDPYTFIQGTVFAQMFGSLAELRVNSYYGDSLGPMIIDVMTETVPQVVSQNTYIGWNITIQDNINGFKVGFISFMSNVDLFKYQFRFDASNRYSGDKYLGNYQFLIPIDYRCRSQVFSIFKVYLEDEMGHISDYRVDRPNTINGFNPTMYFSNFTESTMQTTNCDGNGLVNPSFPKLKSFDFNPKQVNTYSTQADRLVKFSFTTFHESGILLESKPIIYIQDNNINFVSEKSTLVSFNETYAQYSAAIALPYGFGGSNNLTVSIFGIIANQGVIFGFNPTDLLSSSFPYSISVTSAIQTSNILISKTDPATSNGGQFFVYGNQFTNGDKLLVRPVDDAEFTLTPYYSKSSIMLVQLPPMGTATMMTIQVVRGQTVSNSFTVLISQPFKPTATCLNGCNGGGTCTVNGCVCFPLFTGTDCLTKILQVTPSFNTTHPQIDVQVSTTIKSQLEFIGLAEVDSNKNIVKQFNIDKWTFLETSSSERSYQGEITHSNSNSKTLILVNTSFNNKNVTTPVYFPSYNFNLNPYAFKYTITLGPYPFELPSNSLQLIFSSTLQGKDLRDTNQCSLKEITSDVRAGFTLTRLKLEDHVLLGRYLNRGVGSPIQVVPIQNYQVDSRFKSLADNSFTRKIYMAVTMPSYSTSAAIDPDFSYLLENTKASSSQPGAICYEVPPVLPTNPPQECLNQCSGNGQCSTQGCICTLPWTGLDCSSKIVVISKPPTLNSTNPETTIILPKEENESEKKPEFYAIISVIGLNELDKDGTILFQYPLNKWTVVDKESQYAQFTNSTYHYMTEITNKFDQSNTTLNVSIDYFDLPEAVNITFANQVLTMNPYSLKYSIDISKYSFSSSLNTLQLVVTASLESTKSDCSLLQTGNTVESESEFVKMQVNDHSLYGRFIKRGVIDGRIKAVSNTPLDTQYNSISTSSKSQTYIGINIPFYVNSAQLDPDFSVLVDTRSASGNTNAICSKSDSKNSLTTAQIAGIVIGGVVFLFIVGALIIYFMSKKGNSKMALKLRKIIK
ncbi:hypothetical protein CYY_003234 [Polysphondylium violaceum]|uniref:EGF-like domain-containing protein n=1 Tax=Polysphondylium violaceum TaxID=133409 RepID=A0A8J4PV21_9MYCE|nr:hypothetical protein CYY_003234 [Polysphondylium violaceum]